MLRRFANSLTARIMALGVFLILIGAAGRVFLLSAYIRDETTALVAAQQELIAGYLARDVDGRITERREMLQRLGAALPVAALGQPDMLRAWLEERQKLFPLFSEGLAVIGGGDDAVIGSFPAVTPVHGLALGQQDWLRDARGRGDGARGDGGRGETGRGVVTIGRPFRSPVDGKPVLVMALALAADGPAPPAVLVGVAALGAPGFLDTVEKTRIGETGGVLLISPRDKMFVSASVPAMILKQTPPTGVNLLHDQAMTGFRGSGITINASGVEELSAITSVDSTGWFVVARLPTEEAFRMMARVRSFILHFGLGMTVLVTAVLLFFLPRLLKPLRDSAREIRRMADGESDLRPLPVVRHDEVGDLVTGFNFLVEQVHRREAELREREATMMRKAHHDALTGLPNRAMFYQCLQQEIAFSDMAGNAFAVMFLDLDGFKPVNDTYGHAAGDEVLRQVATRLREAVRPLDIVARLGGDEFVILAITGAHGPKVTAERLAASCLETLHLPFAVAGVEVRIGASIGIAICPDHGQEISRLLSHADSALYAAKRKGRGRYQVFDDNQGQPDGGR